MGEGLSRWEMHGEQAELLRQAGGRPARPPGGPAVGGLTRGLPLGVRMQGADCLALTKLDVLGALDSLPVCVASRWTARAPPTSPYGEALNRARPGHERLPGWKSNISACRRFDQLPQAAQDYVRYRKTGGLPDPLRVRGRSGRLHGIQ